MTSLTPLQRTEMTLNFLNLTEKKLLKIWPDWTVNQSITQLYRVGVIHSGLVNVPTIVCCNSRELSTIDGICDYMTICRHCQHHISMWAQNFNEFIAGESRVIEHLCLIIPSYVEVAKWCQRNSCTLTLGDISISHFYSWITWSDFLVMWPLFLLHSSNLGTMKDIKPF